MMDSFLQDWRFAWRGLVRSPGFAAVAVVTVHVHAFAVAALLGLCGYRISRGGQSNQERDRSAKGHGALPSVTHLA